MIVFLNFAPIRFMGGAEKWMVDISSHLNKTEPTTLISMSQKVSNLYGQLVLQRKFDARAQIPEESCSEVKDLEALSFVPFTKQWKAAKKSFADVRVIYSKFEVMELMILLYFGGLPILAKTVAGLHSPFTYYKPARFLDRLHNYIYTSVVIKYFLKKMKRIHVINKRDQAFLETTFLLPQVSYIPNGVTIHTHPLQSPQQDGKLHILFVGELSLRKGVDILLDVIKNAPEELQFHITSDGPMKEAIQNLAKQSKNCTYHGYVHLEEKEALYKKSDVLILPSRGEGFPLVILEAMAHGLQIVDSQDIKLGLPTYVEYTSEHNTAEEYLNILAKMYQQKVKKTTDFSTQKRKIFDYCANNLSDKIIVSRLQKEIFA